jgi:hypothetical protein
MHAVCALVLFGVTVLLAMFAWRSAGGHGAE